MLICIAAIIVIFAICIFLLLLIRRNKRILKMKREYGKTIQAKVISWKAIPGRPTRYMIKVEFEADKKKENRMFITSGRFAKKYEYEKDIQIVAMPNLNKCFLEEEDWKAQNILLTFFLVFFAFFLLSVILVLCDITALAASDEAAGGLTVERKRVYYVKEGAHLAFNYHMIYDTHSWLHKELWRDFDIIDFTAEEIAQYQSDSGLWEKWSNAAFINPLNRG